MSSFIDKIDSISKEKLKSSLINSSYSLNKTYKSTISFSGNKIFKITTENRYYN